MWMRWILGGRSAAAPSAYALTGLLLVLAPVVLASVVLGSGCNRIAVAPAVSGPSVLLVTIDTLRADHVGAYGAGEVRTPTLDRLAREGTTVETVVAPTPLTLPSHASIHTGLTPPRHGVRHNGIHRLPDSADTLAERFQGAGYATGAVIGAAVLVGRHGLAQGFDHYDDRIFTGRASATGYAERTAGEVSDAALEWLDATPGAFFLWVHYYDPHGAYRPPEPFATRFQSEPYAGEVAYTDHELGRLLDGLAERGRLADTLVMATADHAESLGEHGESTHAYTLYDSALRVPLLIRGPGVPAGERIQGVASTLDVAPTLLALAGLPGFADVQGRDLLASGPAPSARTVYAETLATQLDHGFAPLHAVRTDDHLYVRAPRSELYDLERDPKQLDDLLADPAGPDEAHAAVVAELSAAVDAALAGEEESERVVLDPASKSQLHALGYVVESSPAPENGIDPKDGLRLLDRFIAIEGLYHYDRLDEAERDALSLLAQLPESPRLLDLLARILLAKGQAASALPHAERAARLVPGSARHREMLASVRLATGDVPGAVADFEAAAELDPGHAEAQAGCMLRMDLGGSLADAAEHAEQALALRPDDLGILTSVARNWDHLGQYDRSLSAWRKLLEIDPENGPAHAGAALQLVRFGEDEAAKEHLDRAGAAARTPRLQFALAIAYAARERIPEARSLLVDLRGRYPDWPGPRKVLSQLGEG